MLDRTESNQPEIISPKQRGPEGYRKGRILTDLLRAVAEESLEFVDPATNQSFQITKKEALAKMVWDSALRGKLVTIDGVEHQIGIRDHLDLIKWIYTHMDGPVKQEVSVDITDGYFNQPLTALTDSQRIRKLAQLITEKAGAEGIRITGPDSESTRGALLQFVAKES